MGAVPVLAGALSIGHQYGKLAGQDRVSNSSPSMGSVASMRSAAGPPWESRPLASLPMAPGWCRVVFHLAHHMTRREVAPRAACSRCIRTCVSALAISVAIQDRPRGYLRCADRYCPFRGREGRSFDALHPRLEGHLHAPVRVVVFVGAGSLIRGSQSKT